MNGHCPFCRMTNQLVWVRFTYLIRSVLTLEELKEFTKMAEGKYQDD